MKKILSLLATIVLIFTFAACSQNNDVGLSQTENRQSQLGRQTDDMPSQLEQQEDKITESEIRMEVYENLGRLDFHKEYDLEIVGDCFAFSFDESTSVAYGDFLQIPDGVVINSEKGIEKLATKSYDYAPEETPFEEAAEFLRLLKTEHFFDGYSFLLINFCRASSDKVIGFSSYTADNNCLNLMFDFEDWDSECGTCDIITRPYIFCIKKIENIQNLEIYTNNLVPWRMNYAHELIYY